MNIEIFSVLLTFFISLLIILFKKSFFYFLISIEIAFNSLLLFFAMNIKESGFEGSLLFVYILGIIAAETAIGLAILFNLVEQKESDNYDV